ncbi:MAG TPA: hypothetical protein VHU89_14795 [Acidobacteriaceae bacterium]|jgi:hypothetical protein|nr:hypothetical protein [Acidobacteriaceae bacterium]
MTALPPNLNFGLAWVAFALAVAVHVADEATHDFLALYNPNAQAIRRRLHIPFPPVFTLRTFLASLSTGIVLLLLLSPAAFHGAHWLRLVALPLAILVGLANAAGHVVGSLVYRRPLAGLRSSPLLLIAGSWLLWSCYG